MPTRAKAKAMPAREAAPLNNSAESALATLPAEDTIIKISLKDMKMLAKCLDRCVDSQRKLSASLTFFSRQFEDERKIMDEAKQAIDTLVARSIVLAGGM